MARIQYIPSAQPPCRLGRAGEPSPAGCGGAATTKSSHSAREPWPRAPTKGHDFLLAGYLLQADGRSNKVSHKRARECVAVVLFNYL